MTKFRLLLRELRQASDLSQEELARALRVSRQSIISLERGEYLPSLPVLISLIEFFGCPIEELIEGISPKNNRVVKQIRKGGERQMQLAPWSPFQAIDRMQEEMNDIIERTFGRGDWSNALQTTTGAMNIHESEKEYEIELQVPGYTEKEISIEMADNTLTVSGAKKEEAEQKDKDVIRREWQHSQFKRSIRFAHPIKEDGVAAKMENGLLKIIAPKVEPVKPKVKKIEIKKN
jgi:HSP20 family protein